MGSSSSSYAPKTIYLDVEGRVQKVGPAQQMFVFCFCFFHRKFSAPFLFRIKCNTIFVLAGYTEHNNLFFLAYEKK